MSRDPFVGALASLAAAISVLEKTPRAKKAAPSDAMFETMLSDYRKALESGRAALAQQGVIVEIAAERRRQVAVEGWTLEHDDKHDKGEMAHAAGCYALANYRRLLWVGGNEFPDMWPWHKRWWKQKDRRSDLIKAGALIVAEIERLDRRDTGAKPVLSAPIPPREGPVQSTTEQADASRDHPVRETAMTAQGALEIAANIAEAIDSGRGNEKQIAAAIRDVAKRGYWLPSIPPREGVEREATGPTWQECVDIATLYDDCGGLFIAEKIRDLALSPSPR